MWAQLKRPSSTFLATRQRMIGLCVSLGLILGNVTHLEARLWKDATGKHEIDAEFVKFEKGKVYLKTATGRDIELSLKQLSPQDQEFVKEELARQRKNKQRKASPPRKKKKKPEPAPPPELDSTETVEPRREDSRNFILHTDVTPPEAEALLISLETVLANMVAYWGQPLKGRIECYVIRDLQKGWRDYTQDQPLDPIGVAKVQRREGVTVTMTRTITAGKEKATKLVGAKAVVYAYADRGIAQHEAVHAYCGQTFGRTGPTWYSEGMAEMGQYWVKESRAVNTPQQLVKFFREEYRHRQAIDIVNEEQITGDSWENYTRRWALCHLLNHNPNYSERFRWIGKAIVTGQEINYPELFGARADQIEFEYQFFVKRIDIGYRVDLCSWDWEARFLPLAAKPKSVKISARRGWQPSKASLTAGQKYEYSTKGEWSTGEGDPVDAKGHQDGKGRLVGVLMNDFQLGEPFELGVDGTFTAPADGHLYLRCRDDWHEIEDNQDHIFVRLKGSDP